MTVLGMFRPVDMPQTQVAFPWAWYYSRRSKYREALLLVVAYHGLKPKFRLMFTMFRIAKLLKQILLFYSKALFFIMLCIYFNILRVALSSNATLEPR
jgi:hypothetical protein